MRFEDVTHRLDEITMGDAGRPDYGLSMREALGTGPVRLWQAVHGGYTWVIAYEPGHPSWDASMRAKFVGYTASYRKVGHNNSSQTMKIDDGGVFGSYAAAEAACRRQWRQIRQAI